MSGDSASALQATIFSTLSGDAALQVLLGAPNRIHDSVPDGAEAPYVSLGDDVAKEWGANTFNGREVTVTLHTWTEGRGRKKAQAIMARINELLHEQPLALTGHVLVSIRFEFGQILKDPDGRTHHGVQRFRALTREAQA